MQINEWMAKRKKKGTLADIARRILASERTYADTERYLRALYMLEAVIQNGGSRTKAAESLGVAQSTIRLSMKLLGIRVMQVREIAKAIKEAR